MVGDEDRAGRALLTLLVDDLDTFVVELAARGIESGPTVTLAGGARKATIADPEGNHVSLGEVPEGGS